MLKYTYLLILLVITSCATQTADNKREVAQANFGGIGGSGLGGGFQVGGVGGIALNSSRAGNENECRSSLGLDANMQSVIRISESIEARQKEKFIIFGDTVLHVRICPSGSDCHEKVEIRLPNNQSDSKTFYLKNIFCSNHPIDFEADTISLSLQVFKGLGYKLIGSKSMKVSEFLREQTMTISFGEADSDSLFIELNDDGHLLDK